jgi:hypothetical protein
MKPAPGVTRLPSGREYDGLLSSIVLYIDWRYVTKNLTTEQRELFADAVERDAGEPVSYVERWWRE